MATGNTDQLSATSNEIAALVGLVLVELAAAYVDRDTGDSLVRVRTENPEG